MKNLIRILILNIALLFVPICSNATTIALHKTKPSSHATHQLKSDNTDSNALGVFGTGMLLTGGLSAGGGVLMLNFLLPSANFVDAIFIAATGFSLVVVGVVCLVVGLFSWLFKMGRDEKRKPKKAVN